MKDVLDALKKAIEEGQAKDAAKAVQAALDAGAEPGAILRDVMVPAMDEVGRRYECGDYFLPEMQALFKFLRTEAFHARGRELTGYDTREAGDVRLVLEAVSQRLECNEPAAREHGEQSVLPGGANAGIPDRRRGRRHDEEVEHEQVTRPRLGFGDPVHNHGPPGE
mgnify:CR=1 FL=1